MVGSWMESMAVDGGAVPRNRGVPSEWACSKGQVISFHCGKVHCSFLLGNKFQLLNTKPF